MNNIWKYSLVLAFSIIIDQLVKGTAQTLIVEPNSSLDLYGILSFVRTENHGLLFGFKLPFFETYQNLICHILDLGIIFWILKKIVFYRNRSPILGWSYTFWLVGIFTSWLDRVTLGYTLDYLKLKSWAFSMGDLYTILGLAMIVFWEIRLKRATK